MQFRTQRNLEKHGFAWSRLWSIDVNPAPLRVNTTIKTFLKHSEEDLKIWSHRLVLDNHVIISFFFFCFLCYKWLVVPLIYLWINYDLQLWISVKSCSWPGDLILTSRIRNTNIDGMPFSFTFAYHTYFSVWDIRYAHYFILNKAVYPFRYVTWNFAKRMPSMGKLYACGSGLKQTQPVQLLLVFTIHIWYELSQPNAS